MTISQRRPELDLDEVRTERFAHRLYVAVRQEVPAYAAITDPAMDRDFAEVNRRNVELFFRALGEDRVPTETELAVLGQSARRRLHQAVPLEAIFHSYRVGVRVLWECLLEVAPQQDHGRLAALALDYADRVSTATAQAYLEERQRTAQSRLDAARLLLTRIIHGETDDEGSALREAAQLGLVLDRPHAVLLVAAAPGVERATTESDLVLADVRNRLQAALPRMPTVLLSTGLVALVPSMQVPAAADVVDRALSGQRNPTGWMVGGIGTASIGIRGLAASHREAVRARALGALLHPDRPVHHYAELRMFDLFREGEVTDAYVREVLGPVLAVREPRRGNLLDTLEAVFGCALNHKQAAARLGIHQNTLALRLQQLEKLLGGSFSSGEFCFRTELALRLLPLAHDIARESSASGE